jgi:hypothetical protein
MAAPDPIRAPRLQGQVSVVFDPRDARCLLDLTLAHLAEPSAASMEQRSVLLALACQLLRGLGGAR